MQACGDNHGPQMRVEKRSARPAGPRADAVGRAATARTPAVTVLGGWERAVAVSLVAVGPSGAPLSTPAAKQSHRLYPIPLPHCWRCERAASRKADTFTPTSINGATTAASVTAL